MAGADYNRKRYYTPNRNTDTAGDYFKRILKQNTEIEALKTQVKHLESEVLRLERELASRG